MKSHPISQYLIFDKIGRWIVAFGKYEGEFLSDVVDTDPEYVEWLLSQQIPEPVREVIEESVSVG